jgi:hypothetical protein
MVKKSKRTDHAPNKIHGPSSLVGVTADDFNIRMDRLIRFIRTYLNDNRKSESDVHHDCCLAAMREFQLREDDGLFPIWLSRIIAGEMNDIQADDTDAFPNR